MQGFWIAGGGAVKGFDVRRVEGQAHDLAR